MFGLSGMRFANQQVRIPYTEHEASERLGDGLSALIPSDTNLPLVFVCIGTDRSTGDALGPLVGTRLRELARDDCIVFGTLDDPVHAVNLHDTLVSVKNDYPSSFIVAIDACLGQLTSVGVVSVNKGPLKPGAGVNKDLPEVGHAHVTGIVNVGGFMEYFVLQNTRLSIVMRMADCIADAIEFAMMRTVSYTSSNMLSVPSLESASG